MTRSAGTSRAGGTRQPMPVEIDVTVPSIARIYDYVLGGKEHFACDRAAAEGLLQSLPEAREPAVENRAFLRRAVRFLVGEAGIRQIVDIGSGLPTAGNVHEVAHAVDPSVRVVYVDVDPIVLAHGRALLADNPLTTVVTADVRRPDEIFDAPDTRRLLDTAGPSRSCWRACCTTCPTPTTRRASSARSRRGCRSAATCWFRASSAVTIRERAELERAFVQGGISAGRFRTWPEQRRFFAGLEMVEPGLVYANDWRPDAATPTTAAVHTLHVAGVGRKVR